MKMTKYVEFHKTENGYHAKVAGLTYFQPVMQIDSDWWVPTTEFFDGDSDSVHIYTHDKEDCFCMAEQILIEVLIRDGGIP